MRRQVRDAGHDLGHARLVVGPEQRVPAAGDDVVPGFAGQLRHRGGIEPRALPRELQRPAAVGAVHDRLDALAGGVRTGVHVRDQPDRVASGVVVAGQCGDHVAVLVEHSIPQPGLL